MRLIAPIERDSSLTHRIGIMPFNINRPVRVLEWRDLLLAEGGASGDRAVESGVQHEETAFGAGL
jgi:hypothetical protein